MRKSKPKKSVARAGDIIAALRSMRTEKELRQFLGDLLSDVEWEAMQDRWRIVCLLHAGVPYTEIIRTTGISSTTIARAAKWLKKGKGGYRLALQRLAA